MAGVVVVNAALIYAAWWQGLEIPSKPGVRAAVAAIEALRKRGEPVVVTSPFYFPSVLFYLHDRER